jgi:hypothetical protein
MSPLDAWLKHRDDPFPFGWRYTSSDEYVVDQGWLEEDGCCVDMELEVV